MDNIKVKTEMEALQLCKENQCKVEFKNEHYGIPAHVIVKLGLLSETIGKDLVEAVNRMIDMYYTAPINHEKLPWWEELKNFYKQEYYK